MGLGSGKKRKREREEKGKHPSSVKTHFPLNLRVHLTNSLGEEGILLLKQVLTGHQRTEEVRQLRLERCWKVDSTFTVAAGVGRHCFLIKTRKAFSAFFD
eukprot:NODE_6948_length_520_cov_17.613588_g6517_i0.p1 GENE.NODE_6948_length_520_cov_17.613588_g6517_i0~~NODE_6948_length_520_cov_17.613588_g6517_i0.p1  ORF type:complete len:100 (-),score=15.74 NODE_6948_length_520_cov_17.613588_g6517_i0:133-432(-)